MIIINEQRCAVQLSASSIYAYILFTLISVIIFKQMKVQFSEKKKPESSSQNEGKDLFQNTTNKTFNQLRYCRPYPFQSSIYYRIIVIFLYFLYFANLLLVFKYLVTDTMFLGINVSVLKFYVSSQNSIWFGVNAIFKIVIISDISLQIMLKNQEQKFKIIYSTSEKIKKFLRLFIEIDLQLTSLLLLTLNVFSIINLLVTIVIIIFSIVFLQNYCEVKDRFYVGNFYYFLVFRLSLIFGYLANILALYVSNNILFLMGYHTTASIIILILYLINGWTLYKDSLLRWSLMTFISLYLTISINLFIYYFCVSKTSSFVIHNALTFAVIQCCLYQRIKSQQIKAFSPSSTLQEKCFSLINCIEDSYIQVQQKANISALLKFHSVSNCGNQKCYSSLQQNYDSKKMKYFKTNEFLDQRASLSKFYLRCHFQTYLQSNPRDDRVLMSYCELLYWKFRNIGQTIFWFEVLKKNIKYFSFGTLIKFNGLYDILKKDSQKFCDLLYNKNLDIEHLIDAENTYESIVSRINSILRERLESWRLVQKQEIDLSLVREKIQPTFGYILQISQDWKKISKYLKHSNKWKQQYLFFILYIKNQKIKNKVLEQFESTTEKTIDLHNFLKKGCDKFQLKSLFSEDTCCLTAYLNDSKVYVKRVSNNFTIFTQYQSAEMINSDISILLPDSSALYHQKIINQMHTLGKFADETVFKVTQTYLINKPGFIIPVFKIFKEFVNENGELEYVCFFKKIEAKEVIILCNEYFQIQHFTANFTEELFRSKFDSQYLRKMNLLSMIPSLAQKVYRSFLKFASHQNEDLVQKIILSSQELFVQIQYPSEDIASYLLQYQNTLQQAKKQNLADYFAQIKLLQAQITKNSIKLQMNITLNQIQNSQCRYYQIKMSQVQLRKQIKNANVSSKGSTIIQKFGISSSTAQSKNLKDQLMKKDRRISSNIDPVFQNIFIKEEGNQVPHKNIYLKSLKYIWILFLVSLGIVSNINLILLSQKYGRLQQFSVKIGSILQINYLSSNIIIYYQSYLLNTTAFSYLQPKIISSTNNLEIAIKSHKFHQIIFDKFINTPQNYSPLVYSSQNKGLQYNQIDFVFFVQSLFHSLATEANLTANTLNYKLLINYYYPSFVRFTNKTKSNLHQSFKYYINEIQIQNTIIYSVQSLIFVTIILTTIFTNLKFFRAMFQMMKIHCQFNSQDVKKIMNYYKKTLNIFKNIEHQQGFNQFQNSSFSNLVSEAKQKQSNEQNNNLNKRQKDISVGKKQINSFIWYVVKVVLCLMCLIGFSFWQNAYLIQLTKPIVDIQAYGYKQFLYSPTRFISSLIISNQYIYQQQFAPKSSYKQIITNTQIQKNTPYLVTPFLNTKFYIYIQDVYFTNLCQLFKDQIKKNDLSFQQCSTIAESSFLRGIVPYSGFQYEKINQIFKYSQGLTSKEIKQYYRSLQYSKLFLTNLVSTWQSQFFDLCEWALFIIKVMLITSNGIVLLVMLFGFISLFDFLEKQYRFYKQFYNNMMILVSFGSIDH